MENHLKTAAILANLLDNQFNFLGFRFGLSAVFELIPEVGDVVTLLLSLYLIWIAVRMELPSVKIAQMILNVLINFIIGLLPIAGEVIYVMRKANMKNLRILQEYSKKRVIEGQVVQ